MGFGFLNNCRAAERPPGRGHQETPEGRRGLSCSGAACWWLSSSSGFRVSGLGLRVEASAALVLLGPSLCPQVVGVGVPMNGYLGWRVGGGSG